MTRVAPLAPPWSEDDAAGINNWGHPDRTYEPLLLVRCLQRHPALAAKLRKLGEARVAALASGKVTAEQFASIVDPLAMVGHGVAGA